MASSGNPVLELLSRNLHFAIGHLLELYGGSIHIVPRCKRMRELLGRDLCLGIRFHELYALCFGKFPACVGGRGVVKLCELPSRCALRTGRESAHGLQRRHVRCDDGGVCVLAVRGGQLLGVLGRRCMRSLRSGIVCHWGGGICVFAVHGG